MDNKFSRRDLVIGLGVASVASPAFGQIQIPGGLGGGLGNIGGISKLANGLSLSTLLKGGDVITTSLKDAIYGAPAFDSFVPPIAKKSLTTLKRTNNGGFVLGAGYFDFNSQSYCFHAGTYGPGGGDAYLYAPTLGSGTETINTIRQNSYLNPDIEQRNIQTLIWAILSRSKFENLSNDMKLIAGRLLTQKQLLGLNRNALDVIPASVLNKTIIEAPPAMRQVLQAEGQLRSLISTGGSYASLESAAILTGVAPWGAGSIKTPENRWSLHPDGYYIRFKPKGYSHTYIEIWVDNNSKAIGKTLDLSTIIAVPCNTSRQRLGQSNRERKV